MTSRVHSGQAQQSSMRQWSSARQDRRAPVRRRHNIVAQTHLLQAHFSGFETLLGSRSITFAEDDDVDDVTEARRSLRRNSQEFALDAREPSTNNEMTAQQNSHSYNSYEPKRWWCFTSDSSEDKATTVGVALANTKKRIRHDSNGVEINIY